MALFGRPNNPFLSILSSLIPRELIPDWLSQQSGLPSIGPENNVIDPNQLLTQEELIRGMGGYHRSGGSARMPDVAVPGTPPGISPFIAPAPPVNNEFGPEGLPPAPGFERPDPTNDPRLWAPAGYGFPPENPSRFLGRTGTGQPVSPPAPANDNNLPLPSPAGFRVGGPGIPSAGQGNNPFIRRFPSNDNVPPRGPTANDNAGSGRPGFAPDGTPIDPAGFYLRTYGGRTIGTYERGQPPTVGNDNLQRDPKPANDNRIGVLKISNPYSDKGVSDEQFRRMQTGEPAAPVPMPGEAGANTPGRTLETSRRRARPLPPSVVPGSPAQAAPITGSNAQEVFLGQVEAAESGGNPRAKNPLSSATGLGQYTKGTWELMMKRHPELGLTANGRTDPVQSRKALRASAQDYADVLERNRLPVTPGSLYALHFLGEGDGPRVLSMPNGTPMASAVSKGVVSANPFLRGMSVGEFKHWTDMKMRGRRGVNRNTTMPEPGAVAVGPAGTLDLSGGGISGDARNIPKSGSGSGSRGGGGGVSASASESSSSGPGSVVDYAPSFEAYLQEVATRRSQSRQAAAGRKANLKALLATRSTDNAS